MTTRHHWEECSRRGHAVIEIALLSPWIFLLFLGIVDTGFYSYAAISTANAARVAAMYASNSPSSLDDSQGACSAALAEMKPLPNIKAGVTCASGCGAGTACAAGPMKVTAKRITAASSADGLAEASEVSVQYQTVNMFLIPGLPDHLTITRTVQMKQRF
jgi:Flp pilus assembly protein TadG